MIRISTTIKIAVLSLIVLVGIPVYVHWSSQNELATMTAAGAPDVTPLSIATPASAPAPTLVPQTAVSHNIIVPQPYVPQPTPVYTLPGVYHPDTGPAPTLNTYTPVTITPPTTSWGPTPAPVCVGASGVCY